MHNIFSRFGIGIVFQSCLLSCGVVIGNVTPVDFHRFESYKEQVAFLPLVDLTYSFQVHTIFGTYKQPFLKRMLRNFWTHFFMYRELFKNIFRLLMLT